MFNFTDVSLDPSLFYEGYYNGCNIGDPEKCRKSGIGLIIN
jgi:hypothetical protein